MAELDDNTTDDHAGMHDATLQPLLADVDALVAADAEPLLRCP